MLSRQWLAPVAVLIFGALMLLPRLGTLGLWDPWETHYSEVAREMIVRGDYLYPHWESAYFFSKPVFTIWMISAGLNLTGVEALNTWGVRLPFALLGIATLYAVYKIGVQLKDEVCGLVAAFILGSSPLFVFIAKQAMTDMPLVGFTTIAIAFFLSAVFEADGPAQFKLRAAAAALFSIALYPQLVLIGAVHLGPSIAAGGLGALLVTFILKRATRRTCVLTAAYVFLGFAALSKGLAPLAIVCPLVLIYLLISVDWQLLLRSNLPLAGIVFLSIASPWFLVMSFFDGRNKENQTFVQRFWLHDNLNRVSVGVHGDRGGIGYYIEQLAYGMFPWSALLPIALPRAYWTKDKRRLTLFVLVWALWSYLLFTLMRTKFHYYIFPALPPLSLLLARWLVSLHSRKLRAPAALMISVLLIAIGNDLLVKPQHLVNLFSYKYDRPYPPSLSPRFYMVPLFSATALGLLFCIVRRPHKAWGALALFALSFSLWLSHHHFNMLSQHWSQYHLWETYHEERRGDEAIFAYQLNWRGETFYSKNRVVQVMGAGADRRIRSLAEGSDRIFVILEQRNLPRLRAALSRKDKLHILDGSNHNFYLCVIDGSDG